MTFVSYAQNFEDVLLWRALGEVQSGFYIDVGASHPDIDSVSRAFYDRGWRGINVEPTAAAFLRLTAARPRDINLQLAMSKAAGTLPFYVVEGIDAGLSTLDDGAASRFGELGLKSIKTTVEVDTLASICRQHAPTEIHFLKIDVEGAECEVLEGADFRAYRPWIVLVEATAPMSAYETHGAWEDILVDAGYKFVWFDGLNRFYVATEHHDCLAPKFRTPPNVFDNFLRAADTEWTRRLSQAEARAEALLSRAIAAENRVAIAQDLAESAHLRSIKSSVGAARAAAVADRLQQALEQAERHERALRGRAEQAEQAHAVASACFVTMRRSTSWRLTAPMRSVARTLRLHRPTKVEPSSDPEPAPAPPAVANALLSLPAPVPPRLVAVHQFHSGTAVGDAITNAMLLTRRLLRELGYVSQIFAEHLAPGCQDEILPVCALPQDGRYALIVRHSLGYDALAQILALPVPKVLLYHNITPSEILDDTPHLQAYAVKGRAQLLALKADVVTALADSEFNALELRQAGFGSVAVCPLLFDVERMLAAAPAPRRGAAFTVLFVGRLARSKGQLELVAAYARFRAMYQGASRLVLVGRNDQDAYATELFARVRKLGLQHGPVEITGLVSDEELHRRYAEADLYISLSQHEGFGVPLIEAMAHEVPVLAVSSGAVPYTLGGASALLEDAMPARVASRMVELATNRAERAAIVRQQRRSLDRFRLERHIPTLVAALELAGVQPLQRPATRQALADNMQVTVAGHVNGTYSLAEVNRALAAAIETSRPGRVRLLVVEEGEVSTDLSRVPPDQREAVMQMAMRPPPQSGPHVVVSQHYPVWVPPKCGDLNLALFFWEESLVPEATVQTLNAAFDGVLAPTRGVAKALIDSGVAIPVRVLGHTPRLAPFRKLRDERTGGRAGGSFTFLHVSSGFPRKGVDLLLAAYAATFRRDDAVTLVIKTFPNPHNSIAEQVERLRATDPHAPVIELIEADLTDAALLDLYRRADVMVLPTRGEGYNLPAAEALASGLRLIVTGHGGHMDFLDGAADGVRLLDFTLAPAATHLSTPFSLWAEPDPADLAAALREVVQDLHRCGPEIAADDTAVAERLADITAELLLRPPTPPPRIALITTWDVPCGIAGYSRQLAAALPGVVAILADRRTPASGSEDAVPAVTPAWQLGGGGDLQELAACIVRSNPQAVVLQHQPGLIPWGDLHRVAALQAFDGRVACVVLHNTRHLLDVDAEERRSALEALARFSRVVVHTILDVNLLARLGLRSNVTLIPHGAPAVDQGLAPEPRALADDDAVLIGCYGFFLPDKGILQLIEALPAICERFPNAQLRLANAEYPLLISAVEIAAGRQLAASLGVADRIEFMTEFLPDERSTQMLAACDLIVLPYQRSSEASSAALRSAMAARAPIAVTPLPLFDEAAESVFRLPGRAPAELAAGIIALLSDRALRLRVADNAAEWSRQHAWPALARRWDGLLRGLAGSGIVMGRDRGPHQIR